MEMENQLLTGQGLLILLATPCRNDVTLMLSAPLPFIRTHDDFAKSHHSQFHPGFNPIVTSKLMKSILPTSLAALLLMVGLALPVAAQTSEEQVEETRTLISKWVETRQLIAKSQADWNAERELIKSRIELFQEELKGLEEQINESLEASSAAEQQRAELRREEEDLNISMEVVDSVVADYEARLRGISDYFPRPLKDKVTPLLNRIPKPGTRTSLSSGERMAFVMGVLNEVDNFNSNIHMQTEIRDLGNGNQGEVRTIYLGLAAAYYVDRTGTIGAVGRPAVPEWEWTAVSTENAEAIARAIDVYTNVIKPAVFVPLPVEVTDIPAVR